MNPLPDKFLLSRFQIVPSLHYREGRPYQQTFLEPVEASIDLGYPAPFTKHRNWNDRWYAESHLEEWVSRRPSSLFPGQSVHVLSSQNYVHLPEKIDLLILDEIQRLYVVEVKSDRVAQNRGITPDRIWAQVARYVQFLKDPALFSEEALLRQYHRFSAASSRSAPGLRSMDLRSWPPEIGILLLTEGYDEYTFDYFSSRRLEGALLRLTYFRFYVQPDTRSHFVEFYEALPVMSSA